MDSESEKKTVLYIEDNPTNLKLVELILGKKKEIKMISAHTPSLGIDLAKSHIPDLILLDINLPGMNGYEVMQVLKEDESVKNIPVIAITANAMTHDLEKGKNAGFDEYLTKPLNIDLFLKTVDKFLKI